MIRATTGHPARAFRGMAVLLALWTAYRAPEMDRMFNAAIAAAERAIAGMPAPKIATRPARGRAAPRRQSTAMPALQGPFALAVRRRDDLPTVRSTNAGTGGGRPSAMALPLRADDDLSPSFAEIPVLIDLPALVPAPGDLATAAYDRLALGDRRAAARLFDAALAAGNDPRSAAWTRERDRLTRRWSATAYSIVRSDADGASPVTPVLGGAQSGIAAAWTLDPLARAPLALTARATVAHADRRSMIVAAGVAWRPRPGVVVAAERVVRPHDNRGDWTARIAAGGEGRFGPVELTGYAEAGFVGRSTYAAAQARAGFGRGRIIPGLGVWTSIADGNGVAVGRVDFGPGIAVRAGPFAVAADYRVRIAGNAAPGSGPVLTLTAAF